MLSPATLERVSCSYRRGYYDGYDGKPEVGPVAGLAIVDGAARDPFDRPFSRFDYEQGYKAGASDKKW
jgi:hypothetical protein